MYESHFGLTTRPFPDSPHADDYYPSHSLEHARAAIVRCVTRGSGVSLLLGHPGTGKSMLCERIAFELDRRFPVVNLNWGHPNSRRGLLQAILYKLELPYRNLEEGELRLSLIDHITHSPTCPHGITLIVDEAHLLTVDLLEEIHNLTNLIANREPRVRLALVGQPSLEEILSEGSMQSLQQRIAVRCTTSPFRREETRSYIRQAISRCGATPSSIFVADAFSVIHDVTDGIPRLVNQLCDHALIMACVRGECEITATLIHEAWADLQQLPLVLDQFRTAPATSNESPTEDVLEFGPLDDRQPSIPFQTRGAEPHDTEEDACDPTRLDETETQDHLDADTDTRPDAPQEQPAQAQTAPTKTAQEPSAQPNPFESLPHASQTHEPESNESLTHEYVTYESPSYESDSRASQPTDASSTETPVPYPLHLFGDGFGDDEAVVDRYAPHSAHLATVGRPNRTEPAPPATFRETDLPRQEAVHAADDEIGPDDPGASESPQPVLADVASIDWECVDVGYPDSCCEDLDHEALLELTDLSIDDSDVGDSESWEACDVAVQPMATDRSPANPDRPRTFRQLFMQLEAQATPARGAATSTSSGKS